MRPSPNPGATKLALSSARCLSPLYCVLTHAAFTAGQPHRIYVLIVRACSSRICRPGAGDGSTKPLVLRCPSIHVPGLQGSPLVPENLERVAAAWASSIIVVSDCSRHGRPLCVCPAHDFMRALSKDKGRMQRLCTCSIWAYACLFCPKQALS